MNETLEAMARAIFKDWFVDFGPVRAKMEGRAPYLAPEVWQLFPDRLDAEDKPEGWATKQVGELADVVGGSTPSTTNSTYWMDGVHCWATPKDLSTLEFPALLETERRITDAGLQQVASGLLPVGTVLLSSRAPIGYVAIAETPLAINQGFIAMKPRAPASSAFLFFWVRAAHEQIVARANGSTFLEISKANFRPIEVIVAPVAVMDTFDSLVTPLYQRAVTLATETKTLAALRDALLPRLISGQLRVPDAEAEVARLAA